MIILLTTTIFKKINIKFNTLIGVLFGTTIAIYINSYNVIENEDEKKKYLKKKQEIKFDYIDKYHNIIEFIYKIRDLEKINKYNYKLFILTIRKFIELDIDFDNLIEANSKLSYQIENINFMNDYRNKALNYLLAITLSTNNNEVLNKIELSIDKIDQILRCYIDSKKGLYSIKHYKSINFDIKPFNYTV